jgi:hypothetical protein
VTSIRECVEKHRKTKYAYAKVIEHIEGCYEVQEVPFGMVYKWSPQRLVVECGCGERTTLSSSRTTCTGCGMDHATVVQERLGTEQPEAVDEALHPWRCARDREDVGLPY